MRWPYLTVYGVFPSDVFCRSGGWHAVARAIAEASRDEQRCAGTPRPHPRVLRASPFTFALKCLFCRVPLRTGGVWLSLTLHGVFAPSVSGERASRGPDKRDAWPEPRSSRAQALAPRFREDDAILFPAGGKAISTWLPTHMEIASPSASKDSRSYPSSATGNGAASSIARAARSTRSSRYCAAAICTDSGRPFAPNPIG